jgi:ATP:ADP antiporter, AAA family
VANPLKSFLDVKRREVPFVVPMFFYFFLVITVFWILKPIKKALFIGFYKGTGETFFGMGGPEAEQIAKVGNMVVAFVAMVAFTLLSRRLHRHRLTFVFAGFSIVALLAYLPFVSSGEPGEPIVWSFYLFGDLFNTLMVASFFAFLNDSVAPGDAKRLYGPIVLGGVTGGFFGSYMADRLIDALDLSQWLLLACGLVGVIAVLAWAAGRWVDRNPPPAPEKKTTDQPVVPGNAALEGARLVFRSRYLLAIVTILGVYEIVSTITDYQFTSTVDEFVSKEGLDNHFTRVFFITNSVALGVQLFLTSAIMKNLGVRTALLVTPLAIMTNSAAFLVLPILWVGSLLNTTDNALNYSINQSAKESLYTPTSRDEKYKAKAFIDMFVQRAAKAIAVGVNLLLAAWVGGFEAVRWLSIVVVVLVAVWITAASYAGKRFRELTGAESAE